MATRRAPPRDSGDDDSDGGSVVITAVVSSSSARAGGGRSDGAPPLAAATTSPPPPHGRGHDEMATAARAADAHHVRRESERLAPHRELQRRARAIIELADELILYEPSPLRAAVDDDAREQERIINRITELRAGLDPGALETTIRHIRQNTQADDEEAEEMRAANNERRRRLRCARLDSARSALAELQATATAQEAAEVEAVRALYCRPPEEERKAAHEHAASLPSLGWGSGMLAGVCEHFGRQFVRYSDDLLRRQRTPNWQSDLQNHERVLAFLRTEILGHRTDLGWPPVCDHTMGLAGVRGAGVCDACRAGPQ